MNDVENVEVRGSLGFEIMYAPEGFCVKIFCGYKTLSLYWIRGKFKHFYQ